jgi:hypothetical protein
MDFGEVLIPGACVDIIVPQVLRKVVLGGYGSEICEEGRRRNGLFVNKRGGVRVAVLRSPNEPIRESLCF